MNRNNFFYFILMMAVCLPMLHAEPEVPAVSSDLSEEASAVKVQTGVIEVEAKKPVFLYVPTRYKTTKAYPLVISFPQAAESPEDHVKSWASLADRFGFIVLSPTMDLRSGDVPYQQDKWLIQMKNDLRNHYNIAPTRVFLVGGGESADYASYLGVNYAGAFAGVGLLHGGWQGGYSQLLKLSGRADQQIPFYVILSASDEAVASLIQEKGAQLQQKGYPVEIENVGSDEAANSKETKEKIYQWLVKKTEAWEDLLKNKPKTAKEKFWHVITDNIVMKD